MQKTTVPTKQLRVGLSDIHYHYLFRTKASFKILYKLIVVGFKQWSARSYHSHGCSIGVKRVGR